jgi:hypothetical protein
MPSPVTRHRLLLQLLLGAAPAPGLCPLSRSANGSARFGVVVASTVWM